jgi:hypothetical protein
MRRAKIRGANSGNQGRGTRTCRIAKETRPAPWRASLPAALAAAILLVAAVPSASAAVSAGGGAARACPTTANPAQLAGIKQLRAWNKALDDFGFRPTGSRNHVRYVNWLARKLGSIPGVKVGSLRYRFNRWLAKSASLSVTVDGQKRTIRPAGPVPYSQPTSANGPNAPLVYLPTETDITAANSAGKIVVRDLKAGELPNSVFNVVAWSIYDPGKTLDPNGIYKRPWLNGQPSIDMAAAGKAGAAGVLFVHELPRAELGAHYRPYDGIHWKVPALHLGVDEGEALKREIASGAAPAGRIAIVAKTTPRAPTRTLVAKLDGPGKRRFVVETHSDGVNALWDNGSVPILAIANYFARLPRHCRPGPMEFVLTTAHLYQRLLGRRHAAGDALYAERMDRAYERGTLALVLSLEHFGAYQWDAVPRTGGRPGLTLRRRNVSEPSTTFVTESPFLVKTLERDIKRHKIGRSLLLKGTAPADDSHVPPYCSFGGEGTPYMIHLIPTVAFIAAPWTLFNPGYGLEQIDFGLLRKQTLQFTDLLLEVRGVPQSKIAGKYTQYRKERRAGKPVCPY